MKSPLDDLKKFIGFYRGQGINHEGEKFDGIFELTEIAEGTGYQIKFQAKSLDEKKTFHTEVSILSATKAGGVSLFNLNSNTPFMCEHKMVAHEIKDNTLQFKFRFGNIEDKHSFREEIYIEAKDHEIFYQYSWGLPEGVFADRSKVKLTLVEPI